MTNTNLQFDIINALNEFESFGLDTISGGETLEQFRNHIFKHFDQLKTDIYAAIEPEPPKHEILDIFRVRVRENTHADNSQLYDEIYSDYLAQPQTLKYHHAKLNVIREFYTFKTRLYLAGVIGDFIINNAGDILSNTEYEISKYTDVSDYFENGDAPYHNPPLILAGLFADTFENELREIFYYTTNKTD